MRTWTHTEGRACEDTGRGRVHTPGREASGGTGPAHTWISAVQPPGQGQINVCFKLPSLGSLMAARAASCTSCCYVYTPSN